MKIFLLTIFLLPCSWLLIAQSAATFVVVGEDTNREVVAEGGRLDISKIKVENITKRTIYLAWETVYNSFPKAWDCSMCQHGDCQIGIPKGSEFKALRADQQGFIAIHVMPGSYSGKGIVKFKIYDREYPEHFETLTFEVEVQ
ncbi:MAG: hypothetical protein ACRBG0_06870 [Lewinella sp.]|uniref:hypothetical protein n=1 Tax=Lewinella sp. TaxID=2004506 RepID=UPI003D6AEDE1